MARFVLAGKADCPFYAKAEYLADKCQKCLPDFRIRKIPILPEQWQEWLEKTCSTNGWRHEKSPLIWRDVGQGYRGILLGGASEFMEHCQSYYNITEDMSTEIMLKISEENVAAMLDQIKEEQRCLSLIQPLHIWVCSALSPLAPFLIPDLLNPDLFPLISVVSLHLLDLDGDEEELKALRMETEDLAAPRLHQVTVHTDLDEAFKEADLVLFLDGVSENTERFREYGRQMEAAAQTHVRVIVFGDAQVNLSCALLLQNTPSKNSRNFVTVATHVENQARVKLADRLRVHTEDVRDLIVWGNIGGRFYIDVQRAQVYNLDRAITCPPSVGLPLRLVTEVSKWTETELQALVHRQRTAVSSRSGRSAAMSSANAVLTLIKFWSQSGPGTVLSVGVDCSGLYGLPDGLVLSVPVQFKDGEWSVLSDLHMDDTLKEKLQLCAKEFLQDKERFSQSDWNKE